MRVKFTRGRVTLVAEPLARRVYRLEAFHTDALCNLTPLDWAPRTLTRSELFDQLQDLFDEADQA